MTSFDGDNGYISVTGYDAATTDCSTSCDVTFAYISANAANTFVSVEVYADTSQPGAKFGDAGGTSDIANTTSGMPAFFDAKVTLNENHISATATTEMVITFEAPAAVAAVPTVSSPAACGLIEIALDTTVLSSGDGSATCTISIGGSTAVPCHDDSGNNISIWATSKYSLFLPYDAAIASGDTIIITLNANANANMAQTAGQAAVNVLMKDD